MSFDGFLLELFPPTPMGGDNFADRFAPAVPSMAPMAQPPGDDAMLPPNASPTAGPPPADISARLSGNVPLPPPRPADLDMLAGRPAAQPPGPPLSLSPPPPAAPAGPDGAAAPPPNLMDRLSGRMTGWQPGGGTAVPTPADQPDNASGLMGRLMGVDASGEKRLRTAIAGGFAGGNPNFAGGALMKGASGGLSGGLKSDKEDSEAATAAEKAAQTQSNFDRTQGDKEKSSEALRKLYGQRGAALETNAATRAANPPGSGKSAAWNKPASQRYVDAEHLISSKNKEIDAQLGADNPLLPKADRDARRAQAQTAKDAFKASTYRNLGLNADGSGVDAAPSAPATPSTNKVVGDGEGAYDTSARGQALDKARDVIARGANPQQVKQHLQDQYGITVTDDELNLGL